MAAFSKEELEKIESQIEQDIRVGVDGFTALVEKVSKNLKDRMENAAGDEASSYKAAYESFNRTAKSVSKNLDNLVTTQAQMIRGELSYNQIVKRGNKLRDEIDLLETKRRQQQLKGKDLTEEENVRLAYYKALLTGVTDQQADMALRVENSAGAMGEIFQRLSKTPVIGQLLNMKEATEAMRKSLFAGNSLVSSMGKGFGAMFKGLGPLAIGLTLLKAFVDLLIRADQIETNLQKNFGLTRQSARALNKELQNTTNFLAKGQFTTEQMQEGFKSLVELNGGMTDPMIEQSEAAATLTERLGLSGDEAAFLVRAFEDGENTTESIFNNMAGVADELYKSTGFATTASLIMKELGKTSADILANFGFSGDELARAVVQTRRFGVNLTQARNIAEGLLDFEQSISSELEAEILTGRQFNFERARALAATGDIASATEEVLAQTQSLNDEQLRSPIIQKAIAAATGLSADEFIRARKLAEKLAMEINNGVAAKLEQIEDEEKRRFFEEGILRGQTYQQIQNTLTAQEKFNTALSNAKDQFAGLVNTGFLDTLTRLMPRILKFLANKLGASDEYEKQEKIRAVAQIKDKEGNAIGQEQAKLIVEEAMKGDLKKKNLYDRASSSRSGYVSDNLKKQYELTQTEKQARILVNRIEKNNNKPIEVKNAIDPAEQRRLAERQIEQQRKTNELLNELLYS